MDKMKLYLIAGSAVFALIAGYMFGIEGALELIKSLGLGGTP